MKKIYILTRDTEILGVFETKELANFVRLFKSSFEDGFHDISLYHIRELIVNKTY